MGVDMSNNPPTKDFFASPALSLTLAGIFRGAGTMGEAASVEVEVGDEGSRGRIRREETVDMSSENSGPVRSRSEDIDGGGKHMEDDEDGDDGGDKNKRKKRKKYHRHTPEQIREMEALFKESPHPDEKQRQQLSKNLGLAPRQVKFWFQNRRTQIKAIQERHENSLFKQELEKLREENKAMREALSLQACCPKCGMTATTKDVAFSASCEDQQLRIENAKLKAEVEKLKAVIGKNPPPGAASTSSSSAGNDHENRSSLDFYSGIFGLDEPKIVEIVNQAAEEVTKMSAAGDPLWVRSVETGREILNYDEYVKEFAVNDMTAPSSFSGGAGKLERCIEASRETGVIFVDLPRLIQSFLDVNQWKEMFPCLISKAATVNVICNGEGRDRNGAIQLMFAELQMLTPLVPSREVYFVRYCKQVSPEKWVIADVSIDKVEENIDASLVKCRKRPSGFIIEDKSNGHCKVTWIEHVECQKSTVVHSLYRTIVNSGSAFGARHWISTLQQQCERLVFFMATNVPTKDSTGVTTLAGRKSILKLAQRMKQSFCHAIGASSYHTWNKVASKTGEDVRVSSRKNLNDPGEPVGVIVCAVSSIWLPLPPNSLFHFLRDETRRLEWDIMSKGSPTQSIACLSKGQDRGNSVTLQAMTSKENGIWVLQDSSTNAYEQLVVYAPVDMSRMQSVITGCDSSDIAILPSGFAILPDGIESRPVVITSRLEKKSSEGGSLLTVAFQILTNSSPTAKVTVEAVESGNTLISCTLQNIKKSLQCEDS